MCGNYFKFLLETAADLSTYIDEELKFISAIEIRPRRKPTEFQCKWEDEDKPPED